MVNKYTCKNGVRVVLEEIPTVRSVAIGIWIGTGSRNEDRQNNGISHFLEHMFFKGTENRNARDIAESFDRIGGQVNAFTSKEYTCFYAKVLDDHASFALEVLADMFFHSSFDEGEMEKEKNVVLEEIKMYEDTPDDIVHDLLSRASYGEHPLGFPILGTDKTLASFSGEMLRDYMKKTYTPDNIVISVAGNIKDSFIKEVEEYFGSYQTGFKREEFNKPVFIADQIIRKKDTEQAHLCLGFDGLPVGDKYVYDLIILNNILGGSMSSRLFQEVREQKGLAYSIFSYHSAFEDNGMLTVYGGTGEQQTKLLYDTIMKTIEELKNDGISEKELINSKEQMKGSLMLSLESTNSRMSRNGRNELLLGRHRTLDEMISKLDEVNEESIKLLSEMIFSKPFSKALISPSDTWPTL
ncbi:pitrilysin family protein [Bacillus carboniphilus]|uniref:Pitrilysin family protein n=1 Tax=Bacillus carboniphilus TaxID=86663 RepID=A0ABY9JVS2_9BACI|nr:pitrilysin family protein [Bacillus carboniphilus]WLR43497.1 pitrilysin family protein [Bacillus carboniphilus]